MMLHCRKSFKVALLGNMNNNHFVLLRFLRDLGIDAHLFLYRNEQKHFLPENDTWEIDKWKPFIHWTSLCDGGNKAIHLLFITSKKIQKIFRGFDIIIGNGLAPAYCYKGHLVLDLFLPYAYGIEYVTFLKPAKWYQFKKLIAQKFLRYFQSKGLTSITELCCTLDFSEQNIRAYRNLGVSPFSLAIPMVYNREIATCETDQNRDESHLVQILDREPIIFSHCSHMWKSQGFNKRNDILIKGFRQYIVEGKASDPLLVLFDYGPDVDASKSLIASLGIEKNVLWMPQMKRKEIMLLLRHVDFGGGEFAGTVWGGTGWEFLAMGVPFFQWVDMSDQEFEKKTGLPMPPILNVRSAEEIAMHLLAFDRNKGFYREIGRELQSWYNKYSGLSLAIRYKSIIERRYWEKLGVETE